MSRSCRQVRAAGLVLSLLVLACAGGTDAPVARDPGRVGREAHADASVAVDASPRRAGTAGASPFALRPPPPPPRRFTLAATGDILVHAPVAWRAQANAASAPDPARPGGGYDFRPMLAEVARLLAGADLAVCHLETPLSANNGNLSYYPVFRVPREIADALVVSGYDACSTASNHAFDAGAAGVASTIDVLHQVGLMHTGTARSPAEAATPRLYAVGAVTVGHLSYTYGLNGFRLPADAPWLVNVLDATRILRDARALRQAGAEFVFVSLHWGAEYQSAPTTEQQALARQLLPSADIDLLVGHHAHVVQPLELIGDEWVAYGLGNFLSNQSAHCCAAATQDGLVALFDVVERDGRVVVERVRYAPTWVERGSYRILPVADALAAADTSPETRVALEGSWQRTVGAVTALGADAAGAVPVAPSPPAPS